VDEDDVHHEWELSIQHGHNENAVVLSDGVVRLYPEAMSSETKATFHQVVSTNKEEEGSVEREDVAPEVNKLKEMDKTDIDRIASFFESKLSARHGEVLRRSLYLQHSAKQEDVRLEKPIDVLKGELKDRYGYVAIYLNHLVSSGYFNDEEFFREMYTDIDEQQGVTEDSFREEFELIVERELIALYVGQDDKAKDSMWGVLGLISGYFRHEPHNNFLDVRGIGEECEATIEDAMELVKEHHENLMFSEIEEESDEMAIRILPQSLTLLG
jgi:hypothetical protein